MNSSALLQKQSRRESLAARFGISQSDRKTQASVKAAAAAVAATASRATVPTNLAEEITGRLHFRLYLDDTGRVMTPVLFFSFSFHLALSVSLLWPTYDLPAQFGEFR